MEDKQDNRLVRKFYKCHDCKIFKSELVNPFVTFITCDLCNSLMKEISEPEYKKLKKAYNEGNHNRENDNNNIPSSGRHRKERNRNRERDYDINRQNEDRQQRGQSSLHSSRIIFNNINEGNYNNRNNNNHHINYNKRNNNDNHNYNNNRNNINMNNINSNRQERRNNNRHHQQNRRRRDRSSERGNNNDILENLLGNMFRPMSHMENPNIINANLNPFRIVIQRQNVPQYIFDPIFLTFGSMFNGAFQDNYSSNFSSNYRGNFINEMLRRLEHNQAENRRHRKRNPPTSNENLNKLKQFKMNEKYCKKEKEEKYELPNCCICLDEISLGAKTILLPCGHMFHSDCIITWLKKNNSCPMCRFEIK